MILKIPVNHSGKYVLYPSLVLFFHFLCLDCNVISQPVKWTYPSQIRIYERRLYWKSALVSSLAPRTEANQIKGWQGARKERRGQACFDVKTCTQVLCSRLGNQTTFLFHTGVLTGTTREVGWACCCSVKDSLTISLNTSTFPPITHLRCLSCAIPCKGL